MIDLNYHHLYYFYVTARSGSVTKACKSLLLSQPAVSTQIRQLERSLGCRLFERRKQRLHMTEEGRNVLDYAESIFEAGRELKESLRSEGWNRALGIRVGVLSGAPRVFSYALVECVLDAFPSAGIEMEEGRIDELLLELEEHRLDVVLTDVSVHPRGGERWSNRLIGRVPIVFTASPDVARRYRTIPRGLDGAPFILPTWPSHLHNRILDILAEWKVTPRVVVKVQDAGLAYRLAVSGRGIAPLNAYTVSASRPSRSLTILGPRKLLGLYESVYLISLRRRRQNPVVQHLVKEFRLPSEGGAAGSRV